MRYFILEHPIGEQSRITLSGSEAHHIQHVLRLTTGQTVGLFDGSGHEFAARIVGIEPEGVTLGVEQVQRADRESPLELTVLQGMLKEGKMDQLVRPLTELGVTRWIPFIARRSVARPDAKRLAKRLQRWQKISRQAQKQCRRPLPMGIESFAGLNQAIDGLPTDSRKLIFWENAQTTIEIPQNEPQPVQICVLIGPEGGFDPQEVQQAQSAGFEIAGLGRRILRAETAAIAIATLMQHRFGDLG